MITKTIKALDALSIVVMIEQCDLDLTAVTVWHTHYWGGQSVDGAHPAPIKATMCLRCLLNLAGRNRASDGRADLVQRVKEGSIQVVAIGPRDDVTPCHKCGRHSSRATIST